MPLTYKNWIVQCGEIRLQLLSKCYVYDTMNGNGFKYCIVGAEFRLIYHYDDLFGMVLKYPNEYI